MKKKHAPKLEDIEVPPRRNVVPLDQVLSQIGVGHFHNRLWWICGFGFAAAAMEVVVMAFLLPALRDAWKLNEYQLGIVPTVVGVGSILGEIVCSCIADHFGRKQVFWGTSVLVAVFGIISALSPNVAWLCVIRIIVGFGFGGNIAVDFPLYCEFLPTENRNNRLFQMQLLWPLGQCATCLLAWVTIPRMAPSVGWRAFLVACAIPSLLSSLLRKYIPESPRWLLLNNRPREATRICREIAIINGKSPADVGIPDEAMRVSLDNEASALCDTSQSSQPKSFVPLAFRLLGPSLRRTTLGLLIFSCALHAASYGILTLMPSLLERKGIPQVENYLSMTLTSVAQLPGVLIAMMVSRRVGRLPLLKVVLLLTSLALVFFAKAQKPMAVIGCSCLGSMFLEVGWALFHVYVPEVYPTQLRATALGMLSAVSAIVSGGVPLLSAYILMTENTMHAILFFSICCVVGSVGAIVGLHVETYCRELEDRLVS
mmetsp:Transcript_79544/g.137999  ORF Transcript_79544/g.137999 Transcript_79544/m.137999 type:complete len:485 (+) Transcript_79544:61-1515(+)